MHREQEKILSLALGKRRNQFSVESEDGLLPAWYMGPPTTEDRVIATEFEVTANGVVDALWQKAHVVDVRLFVGTLFPALIQDRNNDAFVLYGIPNLNVLEIIELFEVGRTLLDELSWEQFQQMVVAKHPQFQGKSPLNKEMYYQAVLGGKSKCPWRRVRKSMERIHNRHPFEITFVSPEHLTAQLLVPLTEGESKWCAEIVQKTNPEASDRVAPIQLWESIFSSNAIKLWWD